MLLDNYMFIWPNCPSEIRLKATNSKNLQIFEEGPLESKIDKLCQPVFKQRTEKPYIYFKTCELYSCFEFKIGK